MKRMTIEEAKALDDLLTETDPEFTDIPGVFARQHNLLDAQFFETTSNIQTKSEATHKPPAQIIDEMVRREIAAVG